jgi:hypothetical protein
MKSIVVTSWLRVASNVKPKRKLTRARRRLLREMAINERVILVTKHPRKWMGIQYSINSFPIRTLHADMVASLAQNGYLTFNKRGYYVLTTLGQLEASVAEIQKKTRTKKVYSTTWFRRKAKVKPSDPRD